MLHYKLVLSKKTLVVFASMLLMVLLVMPIHKANAMEQTEQEGLAFLTDVARLDMTKYSMNATVNEGPSGTKFARYTLECDVSKISVLHNVGDGYVSFILNPVKGSPLLAEAKSTIAEEAEGILERYMTAYKAPYVQEFCGSLDKKLSVLENSTRRIGDIRLEVRVEETENIRLETITWSKAVNGISNRHDIVSIEFQNGTLKMFCDSWNQYSIGNADVNINKEKAISIAKEEVQRTLWTSGNTTVSNVTVVDNATLVSINFAPRDDNKLYPLWEIRMGLAEVYPGGVTSITVTVKADTGEVAGTFLGSSYGSPSDGDSDPNSQSTSSTNNGENTTSKQQDMLYQIVVILSILLVVIVVIITLLKKRNK